MQCEDLSAEDFFAILAEVDEPAHEPDILHKRLNEIIALVRDAAHSTTQEDRLFREFANAPVRLKRLLKKVSKFSADLHHLIHKDPHLKTALGLEARRNTVRSLDLSVVLDGLPALDHCAKAALKVERRGRKPDSPTATALMALADVYVDHSASGKEVWELPASENSKFIKFSAAVLSYVDQRDFTEANLAKVSARLRKVMRPRMEYAPDDGQSQAAVWTACRSAAWGVLVGGAGFILLHPDTDQLTREIMSLGERVQRLAGNEFLRDLPLELDAVGTVLGHGFHPSKAQLTLSIPDLNLSGRRGAL